MLKNTSCFKEFVKYSSLNVMSMIGLSCYILADTFFVAKGMGTNGLAALNLAIPVFSLLNGGGLMLGMGGATRYSVLKSQECDEEANRVFTNTILLTAGLSIVFFLLGVFFSDAMTSLLGADGSVFQMSKTYLQVILLFAPMFMLNSVLLCFVRNDGNPKLAMAATLIGSLSNIILDYIFIFPLQMGIFGAVLATGFAPIISMLVLSGNFLQKKNQFHLVRCPITATFTIVSYGLPSLIAEISIGTVMLVFNIIILRLQGNVGVAAYGVIANLSLVVIFIYTGIAQGIQPIISRNHGTGNRENVQSILRYAMITGSILSVIIYLAVFFGAESIASLFNSEQNPLLQSMAVWGLKIYFTSCLFAGFNIILSAYFTSIEYARPAHIISLLRGFVVVIPMAFLLSAMGGMTGVWLVYPVTELMVSGIGAGLYALAHRKCLLQTASR